MNFTSITTTQAPPPPVYQMDRANSQMRNFARRLMSFESGDNPSAATQSIAAFRVCEKLRPELTTLMGKTGIHALLARALALARMEVTWLRAVKVKSDGNWEGLADIHLQPGSMESINGGIVLLAQLLGLLVAFIGEELTILLLREVWPKGPFTSLDFSPEDKSEK